MQSDKANVVTLGCHLPSIPLLMSILRYLQDFYLCSNPSYDPNNDANSTVNIFCFSIIFPSLTLTLTLTLIFFFLTTAIQPGISKGQPRDMYGYKYIIYIYIYIYI